MAGLVQVNEVALGFPKNGVAFAAGVDSLMMAAGTLVVYALVQGVVKNRRRHHCRG